MANIADDQWEAQIRKFLQEAKDNADPYMKAFVLSKKESDILDTQRLIIRDFVEKSGHILTSKQETELDEINSKYNDYGRKQLESLKKIEESVRNTIADNRAAIPKNLGTDRLVQRITNRLTSIAQGNFDKQKKAIRPNVLDSLIDGMLKAKVVVREENFVDMVTRSKGSPTTPNKHR
jgi:hypothetical protein